MVRTTESAARTAAKRVGLRLGWGVVLASALALCACGGTSDDATSKQDPLLGAWTFSGNVPASVALTINLKDDKSFSFVETVAPFSRPAGVVDDGCVTTDTYLGTYAETAPNTLTWTFSAGTANAVSSCGTASNDSAGTPMTADAIESYRQQGLIPKATVTYTMTSTALVLTPGLSVNASTTFTAAP